MVLQNDSSWLCPSLDQVGHTQSMNNKREQNAIYNVLFILYSLGRNVQMFAGQNPVK